MHEQQEWQHCTAGSTGSSDPVLTGLTVSFVGNPLRLVTW